MTLDNRPQRRGGDTTLLRDLYFNRTGIVLLLVFLISIGLIFVSTNTAGTAEAFWLSLGASLLATAVFAALNSFLATQQFERLIVKEIEETISDQMTHLAGEIAAKSEENRDCLPLARYPATNSPAAVFNVDLNRSISSSRRYTFQGATGRYTIARLAVLNSSFDELRMILPDPSKPDSVLLRAARELDLRGDGTDLDAAREELIDDIWMSIVGAFQARRRCDRIIFCLIADPPIDRTELFEDHVYLTCFSDQSSEGYEFPMTLKFGSNTIPYGSVSRDCARLFSSSYTTKFEIPKAGNQAEFLGILAEVGLNLTSKEFDRYARDFNLFRRGLPGYLTSL